MSKLSETNDLKFVFDADQLAEYSDSLHFICQKLATNAELASFVIKLGEIRGYFEVLKRSVEELNSEKGDENE